MVEDWHDVEQELAPRTAMLILLLEILQTLLKCYLNRRTANPERLVNLARRRSRAMRIWLSWHIEEQARTAAAYTAIGGERTTDAVMEVLATVPGDRADDLFYKLAATPVRGD